MTLGTLWDGLLRGLGQLIAFFYQLIPSYGVAIILLTIAVRTAMIPLTIKQTRSMQETAKLQPEIQRLRAKYKGDRQKLNEEMQKLWQEHGVNPLGGCLPMLLQAPVFFALYRVLYGCGKFISKTRRCVQGFQGIKYLPAGSALAEAIRTGHAGFLSMNLSNSPMMAYRDPEIGLPRAIPYFIWVALMIGTTYYQQRQIMGIQTQTGTVQPQAQTMARIMPVMLGVFSLSLPVALTIYWVTSNLWTIGQQYLLLGRKKGGNADRSSRGSGQVASPPGVGAGTNPGPNPAKPQATNEKPVVGKPKGSGARKKRKRKRR